MRGESERVAHRVRELLDRALPDDLPDTIADEGADDLIVDPDHRLVGDPERGAAGEGERFAPGWRRRWWARVPVRIDPGRRAVLGVAFAVLVAAVITGVWLMASRPRAVPVSARVPSSVGSPLVGSALVSPDAGGGSAPAADSASVAAVGASSSVAAAPVVVDVAGKVRRPGLVTLPAGSRVNDAIVAAGGADPGVDLSGLNLAARVADGQQIAVGTPGATGAGGAVPQTGAVGPGAAPTGGAGAGTAAVIDLNTASGEQLQDLPGVGPVLAQHILDWRAAHGRFTSVDQLNDVSGIGDVKYATLRPHVSV